MKITGISATSFTDLDTGRGENCWVELHSGEGLNGAAVAHSWARPAILAMAQDLLVGEDVRAVTTHWQRMGQCMSHHGDGALAHARAVLDMAAWDLKAKARSEPLWKSLGGARPRANAYLTWPGTDENDDGFSALSQVFGMRGGKLLLVDGMESDRLRLERLRDALRAVTHQPEIMIDAGGQWTPTESVRKIRSLESEFDLTFVQGVTERGDFAGAKRVGNKVRAAVCAGAGFATASEYLPWFRHQAANVIEIDMHHFGVTGALQLADAAYGLELPVTLSAVPGNIHAHLAAVMPYFMSMEVTRPEVSAGPLRSDVHFEAGWGIAGDAPGNGLSVTPDALGNVSAGREA